MQQNPKIAPLRHYRELFSFACFAYIVWLFEFAYQNIVLGADMDDSLLLSYAFAGSMLIGFALALSVIFRLVPRTARYWRWRRYLGVNGFILLFLHGVTAFVVFYRYRLDVLFFSFNPILNPALFGLIALSIYGIMAATSTDAMVAWMKPKYWKFIHRFVYVAFLSMVFHFLLIEPEALQNIAGYLLLFLSIFVIAGHTYLFFTTAYKKSFRSVGTFVGLAIIVSALVIAYVAFLSP